MLQKILCLALIIMSFQGVSRNFVVTNSQDSGVNSFRAMIDSTSNGDTITFAPSTNKKPIRLETGQFVIYHNITIIGNDSTNTLLNGNGKIRIFEIVQAAIVKIFNLSIYNGNKTSGGSGVLNSGTLELNGCHLYKNVATYTNSHVYGGGIFNYGKLYLYNSNVSNNVVYSSSHTAFGGGLYNNVGGVCYIKNSVLSRNYVNGPNSYGGGIYNLGYLQCSESQIDYNYCYSLSYSQGGGITNERYAVCEMTKTSVYGNSSRSNFSFSLSYGGGIYNNGTLTMGEVQVDSNTCNSTFKTMGAGLCADQYSVAVIVNSTFKGNAAYSDEESLGGGVYNYGNMEIYNAQITGNLSQGITTVAGGGMYNSNYANQKAVNCTFSGNKAKTAGGIFNHNNSNIVLYNSVVWNNLATSSDHEIVVKGNVSYVKTLVKDKNTGGFTGNEDPAFRDSLSPFIAPSTGGDFRLQCASILVDAGLDSLNKTLFDLGNGSRKIGLGIDVGAWEVNSLKDTTRLSQTACDSFTFLGKNINKSGEYLWNLSNQSGCDSIVILDASINYLNTRVLQNNGTLVVDMFGLQHQWLRCDKNFEVVPGATKQSFTPTEEGEYAAEVSAFGCKDTSLCHLVSFKSLPNVELANILVYPNPTQGEIKIELPENTEFVKVELLNAFGQNVESIGLANTKTTSCRLNHPPGIYYLIFTSHKGEQYQKRLVVGY